MMCGGGEFPVGLALWSHINVSIGRIDERGNTDGLGNLLSYR
jgi:hypothetical protein